MSGLEALGVASSVLQVIAFAIELTRIGKAVYNDATADDSRLNQYATDMATAITAMTQYTSSLTLQDQEEIELKVLATKCDETVKKLKSEMNKIPRGNAKGSVARSAVAATKYRWRRSILERLEAELKDQKSTIELQLLALQIEHLDKTSASLQSLASDFVDGRKDLQDFVTRGIGSISRQIVAESTAVKQHITEQAKENLRSAFSEHQRQTLLSSTKYSGMNQKFNEISDPSANTYQWVLEEDSGIPLDQYNAAPTGVDSNVQSWPSFVEWAKSNRQTKWYWISGHPGSGKSTFFKFLTESNTTLDLLTKWRSEVRILKYFFWRPGSKMQNSVRGLWCTFANQLLSSSDDLTDQMLEAKPMTREKNEHLDWSVAELKHLCLTAFAQSSSAYCIFVDGLDEVNDEDGADHLIKSLDAIHNALGDRVKLCVSSRLEYRFMKRIGLSWELKLHLLTYADLSRYTWDCLDECRSMTENYDDDHNRDHSSLMKIIDEIGQTLIYKAEGVFLWLVLALQDVIRGFRNGDTKEDIISRVKRHPQGINDLYRDMWNRLNEDEQIYQATAAKMFRYIIMKHQYHHHIFASREPECMLLELAFALDYAPALDILNGDLTLSNNDLKRLYIKITRDISLRAAGLLKVAGRRSTVVDFPVWDQNRYAKRYKADSWTDLDRVTFVHRTAHDYLLHTDHGRSIWGYSEAADGATALLVARSYLAYQRHTAKLDPKEPWNTFHVSLPDYWLQYISISWGDEDSTTRMAARGLLENCSRLFKESIEHSGDALRCAPLATYLLTYPNLSAFALESTDKSDITRGFSWLLMGCEGPIWILWKNLPLNLISTNMQKGFERGLQKEQRVILPLRPYGSGCVYRNTTILEILSSRLLTQVMKIQDDRTTTDVCNTLKYLQILHPSHDDMAMVLSLVRKICPEHSKGEKDPVIPMLDWLGHCSLDTRYGGLLKTTDRPLSPEGGRFSRPELVDLNIIIEVNLSWVISRIDDYLWKIDQTWYQTIRESPPWCALVDLQKRSVTPSAKVLYVLGRPIDDCHLSRSGNDAFAFQCDFGPEGNAILLKDAGWACGDRGAQAWDAIDTFLKDSARLKDMIPVDGRVMDLLARETPSFCIIDKPNEEPHESISWSPGLMDELIRSFIN